MSEENSNVMIEPQMQLKLNEYIDSYVSKKCKFIFYFMLSLIGLVGFSLYQTIKETSNHAAKSIIEKQLTENQKKIDTQIDKVINKSDDQIANLKKQSEEEMKLYEKKFKFYSEKITFHEENIKNHIGSVNGQIEILKSQQQILTNEIHEEKIKAKLAYDDAKKEIVLLMNRIQKLDFILKDADATLNAVKNYETLKSEISGQILNDSDFLNTMKNCVLQKTIPLPIGTIISFGKLHTTEKDLNIFKKLGWVLCDGENGTPDLNSKFIYGTTDLVSIGDPGGSKFHTHEGTAHLNVDINEFTHTGLGGGKGAKLKHTHEITTEKSENIPPYIKLLFLMKIK